MPHSVVWHFWSEDISIAVGEIKTVVLEKSDIFLNKLGFVFNFYFHQSCSQSFTRDSNPAKQAPPGSLGKACLFPSTPGGLRMKHHPGSCQYLYIRLVLLSERETSRGKRGRFLTSCFFNSGEMVMAGPHLLHWLPFKLNV